MSAGSRDRNDESVLSRWSRRKQEAQRETLIEESPVEPAPVAAEAAAEATVSEEKPPLTDADMPPIDSLTEDSDFSPFMSPGVSEELRNLALRKLFHAPVFNIRDGLDEYDDDFTTFEKLGDIVTADMKHQIEMQEQKLKEALESGQAEIEDPESEDVELIEDDEVAETVAEASEAPAAETEDERNG